MNLSELRDRANTLLVQHTHARQSVKDEKQNLRQLQAKVQHTEEAQRIVQECAQKVQESAHKSIAGIVSRCLKAVFGKGAYDFEIQFEQKRGRTEARPTFLRDDHEVKPLGGSGGGCVDIAALALRLAKIVQNRPPLRRLLVLDEPFTKLSKEYHHLVPELLETLSEELDLQILYCTNFPAYQCGKVVRLR